MLSCVKIKYSSEVWWWPCLKQTKTKPSRYSIVNIWVTRTFIVLTLFLITRFLLFVNLSKNVYGKKPVKCI